MSIFLKQLALAHRTHKAGETAVAGRMLALAMEAEDAEASLKRYHTLEAAAELMKHNNWHGAQDKLSEVSEDADDELANTPIKDILVNDEHVKDHEHDDNKHIATPLAKAEPPKVVEHLAQLVARLTQQKEHRAAASLQLALAALQGGSK